MACPLARPPCGHSADLHIKYLMGHSPASVGLERKQYVAGHTAIPVVAGTDLDDTVHHHGTGTAIEPPLPETPSTVVKVRMVSNCHSNSPRSAEYARRCPSLEVVNTTSGISVTAPGCEGLHPTGACGAQGRAATSNETIP